MAGIRERRTGSPLIPGDSENTSPYSYDLVSDPSLRESLKQFENKVIKNISLWPLSAKSAIEHSKALTGLETWEMYRCYDFIRDNSVIKLSSWSSGKNNKYGFEKDPLRAFFAFVDSFKRNLYHGYKYVSTLKLAKEALGSHPLADQLIDQFNPSGLSEQDEGSLDLSSGDFWKTPLGKSIKDFAEGEIIEKKIRFPLTTSEIAIIIKLDHRGVVLDQPISNLVRTGILAGVNKQKNKYSLRLEHLLLCGLALLHLEKGYSLSETEEKLHQLLEGTSIQPFIGKWNGRSHTGRVHGVFHEDSPWLQFPLPQKLKQKGERPPWLIRKTDSFQKKEMEPPSEVIQPKPIEQKIEISRKNTQIEEGEEEVDQKEEENTDEGEYEKSPLEKIPTITTDQLRHLSNLGSKEIQEILEDLPNTPDTIDFTRHAPFHIVTVAMFIQAVARRSLSTFDPSLESYNLLALKKALSQCQEFMARHPQFKNLFQLFQGVKQLVEKDIDKYWKLTHL
ncbi:MAG: hypothetical protein Q7S38_00555 [bacterium]|nr:hypothetical protein [bacterium]